jgi:membrane-bound ClpP family serine protease
MTSLVVGLLLLFHNAPSPYHTSVPLVVGIAVVLGSFWAFAMTKALQVRRRPAAVGPQDVVGALGEVRRDGFVLVQGELWRARSADDEPLRTGEHVRVERIDGLTLDVRPVGEPLAAEQART